ncbi:MAG: thiamine-phosphate kinase [Phycisphaerales bacterium]|nr:thiamine-phosphate kinase [Phycisphaerales bacterium]
MAHDELELVQWLQQRKQTPACVRLGIGDDMAVLTCSSDRMLVSSDLLLDGVHFESQRHSPLQIGRKAVARSLSDCAAMAVQPIAVVASVVLPHRMDLATAKELFEGVFRGAAEFEVPVVGGDTARWGHPLAIDVTVLAEPFSGVEPVTRSGARVGDHIYVTGVLGGSLLGRHMNFTPRIAEAKLLAERLGVDLHAMIDVSDGLLLDLWRVCRESGVGAVLDEREVLSVVSEDAKRMATSDNRTALDHALRDGEDYELLVTIAAEIATAPGALGSLRPLGRVVENGLALARIDGSVEEMAPQGFVH